MLNKNSINEVEKSKIGEYTIPLYNSYCFSNIPGTIKELFSIKSNKCLPKDVLGSYKTSNKVVFFLIDAFGWKFYERYKEKSEFLKAFKENGIISKLTAQFPSSTSGEITTILSGKDVNNHGIGDWYYYEPVVDRNITAFLFKDTFSKGYENLKELGTKPEDFLPRDSFFKELLNEGVKSIAYQPQNLNNSTYSKFMFRDSELRGYEDYDGLKKSIIQSLKLNDEKEYYYVYMPEIDTIGHEFGDNSKRFDEEVEKFIRFIDDFYKEVKEIEDVSILYSADHGQIETDLDNVVYLNLRVKNIYEYLKRNKKGDIYSPCGYYRNVFLHVKDEYILPLKDILKKELDSIAIVLTLEECEKLNIFNNLTEEAKKRIGNLIIIPLTNKSIWFYEEGIFNVNLKGVHGGLSKDEMEIPFLYMRT